MQRTTKINSIRTYSITCILFFRNENNVGTVVPIQLRLVVKELGEEFDNIILDCSPKILVEPCVCVEEVGS
jgi:hypothetical protein